jgi:hypothetical protein
VIRSEVKQVQSVGEWWRVIAGLVLFSVTFGYVEAAVVAYLRTIYTPLHAHFYPGSASEIFPLLSLEQLRTLGPEHLLRLKTELGREFATLLMLAGAAVIAARNMREWAAAFLICFGIWDITFYLFLKLLLQWPASLLTWDILFLLPVPWTGPVITPVLVSLSMIGSGLILLWREYHGRPVRITGVRWGLILLGGLLIFAAFIWDFRNTASGGNPNSFNWILFLAGEAVGLLSFASSLRLRGSVSE